MRRAPSRPRRALTHRAGSQFSLVAAVWAVVLVCATLAAFAVALSGAGYDHALSASVAAMDQSDEGRDITQVTTIANEDTDLEPPVASEVVGITTAALRESAGDYEADISLWLAGPMEFLAGEVPRRAYLLDADTATANSTLIDGRWPEAASGPMLEVSIPQTVAQILGLSVGDTVRLGGATRIDGTVGEYRDVAVVGIFAPIAGDEWTRDPLRGAGSATVTNGVQQLGPFLTAPGALTESDSPMARLSAHLDPHLGADPSGIGHLTRSTAGLNERLKEDLGDSVRWVVVRSELANAFGEMQAQLRLSTSLAIAVLVVLLCVALAAVALIAELVARRRTAETAVLRDRGASPAQLARRAGSEGLVIAATAALLAAPLAWVMYRAVAATEMFGPTWALGESADAGAPPPSLWLAAGAAGAVAAGILIAVALRDRGRSPFAGRSRAGALARSGADVALAAVAIIGVLQLRTHTPSAGRMDPVLVLVPAACVLASAALVAHVLPIVARTADRVPGRSPGIASALAGWHVARGGAMRGTFLAVAAAATATLGTVFLATWSQSQTDQADADVGADIVVAQGPVQGGGAELAASAGGPLTPVVDRPIVLGTRPDGVALFAIDSTVAAETVTGRPEGVDSWNEAIAALGAPPEAPTLTVPGPTVSLTIVGTVEGNLAGAKPPIELTGTPTVVVTDQWGATSTLMGEAVAFDGGTHTVVAALPPGAESPAGPWTVQAIRLTLDQTSVGDIFAWSSERIDADVAVTIEGAQGETGTWDATGDDGTAQVLLSGVESRDDTVAASFSYSIYGIGPEGAPLMLVGFPVSDSVPVLVSAELAADAGLGVGDAIAVSTQYSTVSGVVAGTVGYVPGHAHEPALWADREALRRALLSVAGIDPVTDAWWGSSLDEDAASALRADGFGPVTSRAERATELREDPAQVPLRLAWLLAIFAAAALAVAGGVAHAAAEAQHRSLTLARLRAIGVGRKDALRSHLLQHILTMGGAIVAGIAVGLVLGVVLAPSLVVSPSGQRPVPAAVLVLPWVQLAVVCGTMLALVLAAGIPASRAAVSRSTVAALRAGEVT